VAPSGNLRFFLSLDFPAQSNAGRPARPVDPLLHSLVVRLPRDEPGLFVRDPSLAQRLPQIGQRVQPALQRDPLLDRPPSHSETLAAVMVERSEPCVTPQTHRSEERRQMPEQLVPFGAERCQPPQLRVEQNRILHDRHARHRRDHWLHAIQEFPLPRRFLQVVLELLQPTRQWGVEDPPSRRVRRAACARRGTPGR